MPDERMMRFFLEETSFELPPHLGADDIEKHLEALVTLVRARHEQGDDIFRWSNLETVQIQPGTLVCDLLYQEVAALPIDRDLRLELMEVVNRCVYWDDLIEPVPEADVEIDGVACVAHTIAVVHARMSAGQGGACLTLAARPDRVKVCAVSRGQTHHEVHFVSAEAQLPAFYRSLFELEDMDAGTYMENTRDAFPDIGFVPGLASQFGRFDTNYRDVRSVVTAHLVALNDHFLALFKKHDGKVFEIQRELNATCGVDANPESPNTHANKKAMRERDVVIAEVHVGRRKLLVGKTVSCEWHTKIKPTIDRIHFHPGVDLPPDPSMPKTEPKKLLIVGKFANHLK